MAFKDALKKEDKITTCIAQWMSKGVTRTEAVARCKGSFKGGAAKKPRKAK